MGYNSLKPAEAKTQSILLCANDDIHHASKAGFNWASSPIMCLSAATENAYNAIILYIRGSFTSKAAAMIELCVALKLNHYTSSIPLVAVCLSVSRPLVEQLTEAGVDFVVFKNDQERKGHSKTPGDIIYELKDENRPGRVLSRLCSYIHYTSINDDKELITCKAYANWLVLGPRRLQELCQTASHPSCPYYQSPRLPR